MFCIHAFNMLDFSSLFKHWFLPCSFLKVLSTSGRIRHSRCHNTSNVDVSASEYFAPSRYTANIKQILAHPLFFGPISRQVL